MMFDKGEVPVNESMWYMVECFGRLQEQRNVPKPIEAGILWGNIAKNITRPSDAPPSPPSDVKRLLTIHHTKNNYQMDSL